jgi:hypothetical protein
MFRLVHGFEAQLAGSMDQLKYTVERVRLKQSDALAGSERNQIA